VKRNAASSDTSDDVGSEWSGTLALFPVSQSNSYAWYGMVWYGMVWYGMVWYGMVWYGMAWHGMVWYGLNSIITEGYSNYVGEQVMKKSRI
jgi:hypothetical protein